MKFGKIGQPAGNEKPVESCDSKYEVLIGDIMRGQRASMGKSLLDVQSEIGLRPYIVLAIENGDLRAFNTPFMIGGYVRQYARYLKLDPDSTFDAFREQTGYSGKVRSNLEPTNRKQDNSAGSKAGRGFSGEYWKNAQPSLLKLVLGYISPIGVVSVGLLVVLLTGGGYVSWTLYKHIQQLPLGNSTLRIAGQIQPWEDDGSLVLPATQHDGAGVVTRSDISSLETIGELVPQNAPEMFVSVDRSALTPVFNTPVFDDFSTHASPLVFEEGDRSDAKIELRDGGYELLPVLEGMNRAAQAEPETALSLVLHPVEPSWIQVKDSDGKVLIERILSRGEEYTVPESEKDLFLRAGNSGYLYFVIGDDVYGPAGEGTRVVKQVLLQPGSISNSYVDSKLEISPEQIDSLY